MAAKEKISLRDAMDWAKDAQRPGWDDTLYHSKYVNLVVGKLAAEVRRLKKLRGSWCLDCGVKINGRRCSHCEMVAST